MKEFQKLLQREDEFLHKLWSEFNIDKKVSQHQIPNAILPDFRQYLIDNMDIDNYESTLPKELLQLYNTRKRRFTIEENIVEKNLFPTYLTNRGFTITRY